MDLYGVEAPEVDAFVRPANGGEREVVEVRQDVDALELAVYLPPEALVPGAPLTLDLLCQVAEGVSHFLFLAERARRCLPTTHLELELQAEVDKFVIAASAIAAQRASSRLCPMSASALRQRLFERVRFLHPRGSEFGERYRLANRLAARFVRTLEGEIGRDTGAHGKRRLREFFCAGQREKIEMALAA